MNYFDRATWDAATKHPDWYLRIEDDYKRLLKRASDNPDEAATIKHEVRSYFEELLLAGSLPLGEPDPYVDAQRKPIDTVVIHHTSSPPGYTLARMNAVHLLNIYAPYFANPHVKGEEYLRGRPITSNHYDRDGNMVFYTYHWFVRMDGSAERLLADDKIGWHAGNWDINTRSVAICLDNDYANSAPTEAVIHAVAQLIQEHYPQVPKLGIIGHREANPKTICPGNEFVYGWKNALLALIPE